jgi:hypothetical protein
MSQLPFSWRLRDLPFVARLVIACFLCSVGVGYFSALVQVHVQDASPGEWLPSGQRLIDKFHGKSGVSTIEELITADESLPFGASGTMKPAFTTKSLRWPEDVKAAAQKLAKEGGVDFDAATAEEQAKYKALGRTKLRKERNTEMEVMRDWIHNGLDKKAYDDDFYPMPEELRDKPLTEKFLTKDDNGTPGVKIYGLINSRCVRCHTDSRRAEADGAPLNEYLKIKAYADTPGATGAISIHKLAQTTHVHMLGFSMLYFLTGLLFAMTDWPAIVRFAIAPSALLAQVVDVSFWWLARLDDPYGSMFAMAVSVTGGIAGLFLGLQILLTLWSLFGKVGKVVLIVLLLAVALGGWQLFGQIKWYVQQETTSQQDDLQRGKP